MSDDLAKDALRRMAYGFYSITSRSGDTVNAMVANWVMQVSFEPRLIALGLQKTSRSYGLINEGRVFAVNIFNKADADAIRPFTKSTAKNPDKMKDAKWTPAPQTGCPILEGAAAYVECRVINKLETGGDHDVMVGEVVGAGVMKPGEAGDTLTLVDLGWSYAG
jgi:flavin reductase (DIM6/NTAB) family NADH-FMN oxidoreductase RutF